MPKGFIARGVGTCLLIASICGCLSFLFLEHEPRAKASSAAGVPELTGRVVDLAGVFTPEETARLSDEIKGLEAATKGGQLAVLAVPTLDGIPIEEYSIKVASSWKLGQKGVDNGALFVFATQDHKTRLEIGYGWEGQINDAKAGDVLRAIVPYFQANDFAGGTALVVRSVRSYLTGEEVVTPPVGEGRSPPDAEESADGSSGTSTATGTVSTIGLITGLIVWICGVYRGKQSKAKALARSRFYARLGIWLMVGSIGGCISAGTYDCATTPGRSAKTVDELALSDASPCVLDLMKTIKPADLAELEAEARSVETDGARFRVLLIPALGDEEIEAFCEKAVAKYGIDKAPNGAFLLIAVENNAASFKVYGGKWRSLLGKAAVGNIRIGIGPYLEAEDYCGAVRSAILSLKAALANKASPELPAPVESPLSVASWIMAISVGLFFLGFVYWVLSKFANPNGGDGSSSGGASYSGGSSSGGYSGGGGSFGGGGASGSW
jgi:uncharacterized membrane protein YgcG